MAAGVCRWNVRSNPATHEVCQIGFAHKADLPDHNGKVYRTYTLRIRYPAAAARRCAFEKIERSPGGDWQAGTF